MVSSVSSLQTLRTFGFSVTGNADVDANKYSGQSSFLYVCIVMILWQLVKKYI